MADSSIILSSAAEAELLKPIDEYVGKIQAQIDELRKDGSDKVRSLKNHIAIVKENKNLTKEEKSRMIAKDKEALEKAKAVESSNKDKVSKLIADAEGYLAKHYPEKLKERYNLTIDLDSDWVLPVYDHISDYRHIKKLRGETDYDRVQETFFNDLKNASQGRITWELSDE